MLAAVVVVVIKHTLLVVRLDPAVEGLEDEDQIQVGKQLLLELPIRVVAAEAVTQLVVLAG
jgi:hypothetical protein